MFTYFRNKRKDEHKILNDVRILFVDDDQDISQVSKRILENLGYQVTVRNNATEAFQLFHQMPYGFDLIVTDLMMPDMSGLELSKKILDIRKDIPIILSSGYSESILDRENLPEGITGLLTKPATMAELKAAVSAVIGPA